MDVRCPKCKTLYEFNELRIKGSGVSLKCSQCNHVFRVDNPDDSDKRSRRRWMIRKIASGDVLYFSGMSVLQKWIIDRKVSRDDEISKTGKTWKDLGSIGELSSFFQVAESIERLQTGDHPDLPPLADHRSAVPASNANFDATVPNAEFEVTTEARLEEVTTEARREEVTRRDPAPGDNEEILLDDAKTREWDGAAHLEPGPWAAGDAKTNPTVPDEPTLPQGPRPTPAPSPAPKPVTSPRPVVKKVTTKPGVKVVAPPPKAPPKQVGALEIDMASELTLPRTHRRPDGNVSPHRKKRGVPLLPIVLGLLVVVALAVGTYLALMQPDLLRQWGIPMGAVEDTDASVAAVDASGDDASEAASVATDAAVAEVDAPVESDDAQPDPADKTTKVEKRTSPDDGPLTGSYDSLMQRGYRNLKSGRSQKALDAFSAAFSKRSSSSEAASGMGWAYLGVGKSSSAIASFKRSLGINPRYGDAQIGLGQAYRSTGNKRAALDAYQAYLRLYPNGPKASIARHQVERLKGDVAAETPKPAPSADAGQPRAPKEEKLTPDAPAPVPKPPSPSPLPDKSGSPAPSGSGDAPIKVTLPPPSGTPSE